LVKFPASDESSLPILVLLPGLDGTGILFADFVKALSPSADCLVLSYPKDQPMGYDDLDALVGRSLPQSRPYVLLGESFAGPLALRIAARRPAGLVGLILCVTFARNPFPYLSWARPLAAYLPLKSLPRWLRAPLMWGSNDPRQASSQTERAISGVSATVIRRRIAELMTVDESAALARIILPSLVLRATRDRVISRRATLQLANGITDAKLVEVDGPHLLLKTRPAECAKIILEFLSSLPRSAPLR
jgi:pimeloyl-[acyl-carrier protein] methyl ester esterase